MSTRRLLAHDPSPNARRSAAPLAYAPAPDATGRAGRARRPGGDSLLPDRRPRGVRRGDRAEPARQPRPGARVDRAAAAHLGPAGVLPLARPAAVRERSLRAAG